jgi:DNA primase
MLGRMPIGTSFRGRATPSRRTRPFVWAATVPRRVGLQNGVGIRAWGERVSLPHSTNPAGDGKSQVLAATDIVELVGHTVKLTRAGKDYKGLCPFHQEKTPSFTVSPSKQMFYCYGCKAGGDAISFVMKRDRVEFRDALRTLAEAANIELPKFGASKEKTSERQVLLDAHSLAAGWYEKLLSHPEQGAAARTYLKERGFTEDSLKRFHVGLAPDAWDGLLKSPVGKKFTPKQLAMAGLAKPRTQGDGYYDTFRNRIMFPIRDENGRVIAFGGRKMPGSEDPAKYLNSPETPIFSKGRCLFGLDLARQKIVETRTAVVVEGYTDVVMAHQFGVSNVVSPLGTAMTDQHLAALRRFADRIVLLFDADTAGDAAVDRAVGQFLTQPVEIHIASMPPEVDPDEYLIKEGPEEFQRLLSLAPDALTYKWKQLVRTVEAGGNSLTARQKAVEAYLETLASARGTGPVDSLRWGAALTRVSRLTEIPVAELNRRFRPAKTPPRRPSQPPGGAGGAAANGDAPGPTVTTAPPAPPRPLDAIARAERWILGILLLEPHRWARVQRHVHVENFAAGSVNRRLAEVLWDHQRHEGEPVFNEFLGLLADSDPALAEAAVEAVDEVERLASSPASPGAADADASDDRPDREQVLAEAVAHLERVRTAWEGQKLLAQLRRRTDERGPEGAPENAAENKDRDEVVLLKQLQEKARQPDLRRV